MVDEPTEGLMPANVELVANALLTATQEGMTVLVVDSSFDLLRTLCSRMYAMDRGVLVGTYSPTDFNSPDELAATMLGERSS
jgi:ABC-type branched-subunit amino acid transport system ATPase component